MLPNSSQIQNISLEEIKDYKHKLRKYGKKQIEKTIHLIQQAGFPPVVIVSKNKEVVNLTGEEAVNAQTKNSFSKMREVRNDQI